MRDNTRSDGPWRPTGREQGAYAYLLSLVDPQKEGVIRGQAAVPFFQKSRLPDATLGGIWQLADTDSKGHLTPHEFSVAMKLISLAQAQKPVALVNIGDEVPLPDMEGVQLQHVLTSPSIASVNETHVRRDSNTSTVPVKEKQQYKRIFESSNPVDGAISGAAARSLFMKTKLSTEQLGRIWSLSDPHTEGKLRLPGFIVAMYYIRRIMENRSFELPATCPLSLWRSAGGDVSLKSPTENLSQSSLTSISTPDLTDAQWDVTREERKRYEQFFNNLDTQRVGYLSGDVPVNFFLKSKLPETVLSKVWDLADIKRTGKLTKEEFAVAMHLINARLAGGPVPDKLPPTLIPPS
ncbi:EF-hand, partial [Coemansia reversa NRRL 1564]